MRQGPEGLGLRRPTWERLLWREGPDGGGTALLRIALWPLEAAYRSGVWVRNRAYDLPWVPRTASRIPALGVGNLTVGGAGKTPFTAWAARQWLERGRRPAVVLRGYGDDEAWVHRLLNPQVPTFVDPDRVRAIAAAAAAGAEIVFLDDAFQHRRVGLDAHVLLIAAEDLRRPRSLLPRGPWREPLSAARRAHLVVVSRKSAPAEDAAELEAEMARRAPAVPRARIVFRAHDVREMREGKLAGSVLSELRRERAPLPIAVAGVAHPESVWRSLEDLGVRVSETVALGDHHAYTEAQAHALAALAGAQGLVTTLKDGVKLERLLPTGTRLHVLIQELSWESGREHWDRLCDRLQSSMAARGSRASA